jgi:hypothetical protein
VWGMKGALRSAGDSMELKNLREEFRRRFGSALEDRATLESKVDDLKENHIRAETLKEETDKIDLEILSGRNTIRETLKIMTHTDTDVPDGEWRRTLEGLRQRNRDLDKHIHALDKELASLAVSEERFLDADPGTKWDAGRYEALEKKRDDVEGELEREVQELDQLRARIGQETGSPSTDWEDLITGLRDKGEEAAETYREITAEILAKLQVNRVIQEFRREENTRIADGLKRPELTGPLRAITGRYDGIRQEETGGILVTKGDDEYPLAALSTGAREQVFLALRMGFASIAMEGKTAFLILDDAFQHSDWVRRKNLVSETAGLVNAGWQVFYFCVDDHIRDLFQKEGTPMGTRFKYMELV